MKPRMPIVLADFTLPQWCVGYGPAPERKAARSVKLDPRFYRRVPPPRTKETC
jgi:hypothetical protein